ncbi:MAG: hypothetical protein HQL12_02630 [Candidatus Omnitrophica bacterium]|nr:hypothetical protein [Candidatus Omnitrophota bacterium]
MLRIGIAASKMSKRGLLSYNFYVILIACMVSFFIFLICGFAILPIIFLISLILHALKFTDNHAGWVHMFKICLIVLSLVVGIFNIIAILKNVQFAKNKI